MGKLVHIAVLAPCEPAEFFDLLWEGVWSATFELSSLGVQVDTFKTVGHDVEAQKKTLTSLLNRHYSAIALIPAHSSALNPLIAEHAGRATRVITFNGDAPASLRYSFVGPDAKQGGAIAGELLGKLMRGRGKLIAFPGLLEIQHLADRYEGVLEELKSSAPQVEEIACRGGLDNLDTAAYELLRQHPDVGGIYVGYSRVYRVAAAMERLNLRIPCVGFNNTDAVRPYLERGWVAGVVDESTYQQGYIAVQRAYEAAMATGPPASDWVRVPYTVVVKSNAGDSIRGESLNEAFELLIRQRTSKLRSSQEQLEDANTKLLRLAETDALTGLLNRRKFEEIMEAEVADAQGSGSISLIMVDLDAFKAYNDSYGHHVGDEVLRTVGRILEKCSRPSDFCARLGGDEFCLLLPGSGPDAAAEVKSRILDCVGQASIAPQTLNLQIRLSVGVATMPRDAATAEDLIVAADQAMYAEKRHRRACTLTAGAS
jgi:diguanylate cyclase (GGDEF)-like protein